MKLESKIDDYTFPYLFSDNNAYIHNNGLKGIGLWKFRRKLKKQFKEANIRLKKTISLGYCFYGPFKGEFGHFTAHTLPFLMYLHKNKVKIHYCGMELHKPFLMDEKGNSIIYKFYPLRDFFAEVSPSSNSTVPPNDVKIEIDHFYKIAQESNYPLWDIGDDFYYWFIHRNWLLEGYTHTYNLNEFYKTKEENSCVIFPRGKGASFSHNNGERWDYQEVIDVIKPYFDKIYICGHPSQSLGLNEQDKVEIRITSDNSKILEACSNSNLIITQHSGVNNLGEYTNTQVLIIYKGGTKVEDIGSMNNTLRFRKSLNQQKPLAFAFSLEEIKNYVKGKNDKFN
jgi:hypothetical protein